MYSSVYQVDLFEKKDKPKQEDNAHNWTTFSQSYLAGRN